MRILSHVTQVMRLKHFLLPGTEVLELLACKHRPRV
jgi:hypothetical protein